MCPGQGWPQKSREKDTQERGTKRSVKPDQLPLSLALILSASLLSLLLLQAAPVSDLLTLPYPPQWEPLPDACSCHQPLSSSPARPAEPNTQSVINSHHQRSVLHVQPRLSNRLPYASDSASSPVCPPPRGKFSADVMRSVRATCVEAPRALLLRHRVASRASTLFHTVVLLLCTWYHVYWFYSTVKS